MFCYLSRDSLDTKIMFSGQANLLFHLGGRDVQNIRKTRKPRSNGRPLEPLMVAI